MSKQKTSEHIITDAVTHMRKTQYAMSTEQNELLKSIKLLAEDPKYAEFTFDNLSSQSKKTLESEMLSVEKLNKAILSNREKGCLAHIGIRTNKLADALEGASKIATDSNISCILEGKLPNDFNNDLDTLLPELGKTDSFWGTSKPTFLTTLLETIHFSVTGKASDSSVSTIFHTFNCPEIFDSSGLISSLFINVEESVKVTIPHSGYSFGGDRLNDKHFRPHDCTSFLEMSAQLTAGGASTADLYLTKRLLSKQDLVVVDESWLNSAGGSMVSLFDINTKMPIPGDIWVVRKFNETNPIKSSLGCGGHAGIYLGTDSGNIVTLAYNRDMPHIEGFGFEFREFEENSKVRDQFWLTRNSTNFQPTRDAYPFNDLSDLAGLINFVDSQIEEPQLSGELKIEENVDSFL